MVQEIFIIDNQTDMLKQIQKIFKGEREFRFKSVKTEEIEIALKNIPSLIIINEDNIDRDVIEVCKQIRADDDNSITPIIVCSSNAFIFSMHFAFSSVLDFNVSSAFCF